MPQYIGKESSSQTTGKKGEKARRITVNTPGQEWYEIYQVINPLTQDTVYIDNQGNQGPEIQQKYEYYRNNPTDRFSSLDAFLHTPVDVMYKRNNRMALGLPVKDLSYEQYYSPAEVNLLPYTAQIGFIQAGIPKRFK